MKQLARYICNQIVSCSKNGGRKQIVRIDGFENLQLYYMVCMEISEYCIGRNVKLIAKLSNSKFQSLNGFYQFEAQQMLQHGWVDTDDRMTYYRNMLPEADDKLLVLLLGTDMVADKGGLNDFYAITPNTLDNEIGRKYSNLLSNELLDLYMDNEKLKQICDAFFNDLFSCVPKNLSKVSSLMDTWERETPTLKEVVEQLYASLPEWQIPLIVDSVPTVNQLISTRSRRQSILQKASRFIRRKTYARVTKSTITNIQKKFDTYRENGGGYADAYPEGQAIASIADLQECTKAFISGDHSPLLIQALLHTDYSILDKILETKLKGSTPPAKPRTVIGSPLTALISAMLLTIEKAKSDELCFDRVNFRYRQASLCGVPSAISNSADPDAQDSNMILEDVWRGITRFAGGVVSFIDKETWDIPDEQDALTITEEPQYFFDPDETYDMFSSGYLRRATGSIHKILFIVELFSGDDKVASEEYEWHIDPCEDWVIAFSGLSIMPDDPSYLPFGIMKDLNSAFNVKDEDGFAYLIDHADVSYLQGSESIIGYLFGKVDSDEEREEAAHFWILGEKFQKFRQAVLRHGFYSCYDSEVAELIEAYTDLANHVATSRIYAGRMHPFVRLFVNAFCIGETTAPIVSDIFTEQLLIPPYHPATLEKLLDRMLFIRAGIKEWYADERKKRHIVERIEELVSLSSIHNATDAFMPKPNQVQSHTKTYGYFTLYGKALSKVSFASAQDILRREMVFDDDFEDRDMKHMTRESGMILHALEQYNETFPRGFGTLSIAFVNPSNLQIVVAALYQFVNKVRELYDVVPFALEITIISHNEQYGSRAYLAYWINTAFNTDDTLKIKAFLRSYQDEEEIPRLLPTTLDIVFFFDALDTDRGATYTLIENQQAIQTCMTECRFPMVFKPSAAPQDSREHLIVITQAQFRAATAHTQVLRAYIDHNALQTNQRFELVQSATIREQRGRVIQTLQKHTVWLVCIDSAMDKKTVRELYAEDTGIIGFTTGEGSFGQLNMAITCKPDAKTDMLMRCQKRLRSMFPSWDDGQLQSAASFCLSKARELDGVSILKALNPYDYDINNYLVYLIASELSHAEQHPLNVLIRLDSYRHWFRSEKQEEKRIPDFLQITADIRPGKTLHLHATVIESKIAKTYTMQSEHLPKARKQIEQGMEILRHQFDPKPIHPTIEHRYWLAQLYRALVFLQGDIDLSDGQFSTLSIQLSHMLEGDYEIEWHGRILACQLDDDSYIDKGEYNGMECWTIGQRAIQNILLRRSPDDSMVAFDDCATVGTEDAPPETELCDDVPTPILDEDMLSHDDLEQAQTITPLSTTVEDSIEHPACEPNCPIEPERTPQVYPIDTHDNSQMPLEDIRVLIGKDRADRSVYWEFGNPGLANRHLLITGGSGQGKTYAIQAFLYELARQKISSVVFDYTDGFLPGKLEPPFAEALEGHIEQHIAIINQIPINPFKRQMLTVAGMNSLEKSTLVAGRFASIMKHVYGFGEQQYSALYAACRDGIDQYGDQMNFSILRRDLENTSTSYAKTVLSKMQQLFDLDLFDTMNAFDWSSITERDGKITVIQLTNLDREIQTIITEMLMWDAWYSLVKTGQKDKPFVVVFDEAQNLSIAEGSPAQKILQEGRKYGWSAWFATQFLKGALSTDEISRLYQAEEKLYFKPTNEEISSIAQQLSGETITTAEWVSLIKKMQKGHCIVQGNRIRSNNSFGAGPATMVKVSSFEDRG